jgi:hypothetical protein
MRVKSNFSGRGESEYWFCEILGGAEIFTRANVSWFLIGFNIDATVFTFDGTDNRRGLYALYLGCGNFFLG